MYAHLREAWVRQGGDKTQNCRSPCVAPRVHILKSINFIHQVLTIVGSGPEGTKTGLPTSGYRHAPGIMAPNQSEAAVCSPAVDVSLVFCLTTTCHPFDVPSLV